MKNSTLTETQTRAVFKAVTFAFPTSSNAVKFRGRWIGDRVGSYCVELCDGVNPPKAIRGFGDDEAARSEAVAYARTLPFPWSPLHLKYNPEDATAELESARIEKARAIEAQRREEQDDGI